MKKHTPNKVNGTATPDIPVPAAPSCPASSPAALTSEPATLNAAVEPYLSKKELARRLNRSIRTIDYWRRRGVIPYIKCGHSPMFKWTDVAAHLDTHFRVCKQENQVLRIPIIGTTSDGKQKGETHD